MERREAGEERIERRYAHKEQVATGAHQGKEKANRFVRSFEVSLVHPYYVSERTSTQTLKTNKI